MSPVLTTLLQCPVFVLIKNYIFWENKSWLSTVFIIYGCALCFICRSDTGISKGSSHSLLKRSTNQHTATSQAVSTDLSAIRLKKAGLMSSVGMGLKLYGSVELSNFDLVNITL